MSEVFRADVGAIIRRDFSRSNANFMVDLLAVYASICSDQLDRFCERSKRTIPKGSLRNERLIDRPITLLTREASAKIATRFKAGESITSLAAKFNVNRCTIQEHLDKHGIPRFNPKPMLNSKQIHRAGELYNSGLSLAAVAHHMNVNPATIAIHIKREGYELRPRRGWTAQGEPVIT